MTSESSGSDIKQCVNEKPSYNRRINSNQMMLDLRHQVQHQEQMIRSLIAERDGLTRELDSRLFLVEAQLRREQKHIEAVLTEKEQLIQFQAMQIHSLKQVLSQVSQTQNHYQRNHRSSKRSLSKRYSVALDEYMKDHCVVSRALPVMVNGENDTLRAKHMKYNRTRSLPELRFKEMAANHGYCDEIVKNQLMSATSPQQWSQLPPNIPPKHVQFSKKNIDKTSMKCCRTLSHDILDELSSRRWTSDCDSEHSDSLDSGISSPSIKSRNMHDNFVSSDQDSLTDVEKKNGNYGPSRRSKIENPNTNLHSRSEPEFPNNANPDGGNQKPRRSSSIGNFINRTFSSSSEKMKDNHDTTTRRHSSFSGSEVKDIEPENTVQKTRLINSTNRTFGTNHRSVTKPRDIKFRKLFKFRRRTEPDPVNNEDYMTV